MELGMWRKDSDGVVSASTDIPGALFGTTVSYIPGGKGLLETLYMGIANKMIKSTIKARKKDSESSPNKKPIKKLQPEKRSTRIQNTNIYYFEEEVIGSGNSAFIYRGFHNTPQRPAAVKRIVLNNPDQVKVYKNELGVWLSATANLCKENLNIVQLFEWSQELSLTTSSYYFAMELATTDLERRVQEFKANPDYTHHEKLLGYLQDAANGVKWLHNRDNPIIHRDIKPQNILIFTSGQNTEIAKIADFGISRSSSSATGTNTCGVGTENWMAPEAIEAMCNLEEFENTPSMDIFSLGMTFHYSMSLGEHPFQIRGALISGNIVNPDKQPNKLKTLRFLSANHLFGWMMKKESSKRPTIQQVVNHCCFYSPVKCLEFIVDVAKCLANRNCSMEQLVQTTVDLQFSKIYCSVRKQGKVNWKSDLGENMFKLLAIRKSKGTHLGGAYEETSAMSLVVLIRDKLVHYTDLVDQLVEAEDYFAEKGEGEIWHFSENKYAGYFLNKFPELVPLLWTVILEFDESEFPVLGSLKAKYEMNVFKKIDKLNVCIE